ncbi:TRAP transporter small permease [Polaromonas aquatica]|jgi:TRAP-type C4-dicarboxylate transport system permease small subunit|uniref:TRAP transporter small permease n=1 Tax=Polaromonas aquatica TaxID=332657 RepID=UPI003D661B68
MDRWIDRFCKVLDGLIALLLAVMVVLVFGNVVLRYGFNSGITVSEEVSRWLFVWVTFLGAVVAIRERAHLGSDMLVSRLPVAGKKACLVAGHLLMLYITWLFFSGSLQQARINWDVQAPVTGASVAIFYGAGVVFSVLAAFFLLLELVRLVRGKMADDELVMVRESEEQAELDALKARLAREDALLANKKQGA